MKHNDTGIIVLMLLATLVISCAVKAADLVVNWTLPTVNVDGTALAATDITGNRIYYGSTPTLLDKVLDVGGGTTSSAKLTNLSSGTIYLAMTTRTATDESGRTEVASATIYTYHVKAITSGSRPATEAVLSGDSQSTVLGYKLGTVPVGAPCSDAIVYKSSTTEYHAVSESDVALLSPTYKGRRLVAVCSK